MHLIDVSLTAKQDAFVIRKDVCEVVGILYDVYRN